MSLRACNPISARQWIDEAMRKNGQGKSIDHELRVAARLLDACKVNLLGGPSRRRNRRRKRRR